MAYRFLIFDSFYKLPPRHNRVRKSPWVFSRIVGVSGDSLQILLRLEGLLQLVRLLVETPAGASAGSLVQTPLVLVLELPNLLVRCVLTKPLEIM